MKTTSFSTFLSLAVAASGCGAGVPIQIRLDEIEAELSLDESVDAVVNEFLPPESGGLPEVWPDDLPDICYELLIETDPELGGRIDLTPDPAEDPDAAKTFEPINNGLVGRIELDRLIVRIEENTLNVPLPTVEVQAADRKDADPDDRRAWRSVGGIGGEGLSPGCDVAADSRSTGQAVGPGELKDLEFEFFRGGESYFNTQLVDQDCAARQMAQGEPVNPLACKEFSIRARSRITLDTATHGMRPRGSVKLRLILVATFFVTPI